MPPPWWKRTQSYLSSHSSFFVITGGLVGGAYLLSQYAIAKFQQIQDRLLNDRNAKENLRRRFSQNQEDCTFTVLALLPTVGDQLAAKLNVEALTESLRAQSSTSSATKQSNTPERAQTPPSVPQQLQPQPQQNNEATTQIVEQQTSPHPQADEASAPPLSLTTDGSPASGQDAPTREDSQTITKSAPAKSTFNPLAKEFVPGATQQRSSPAAISPAMPAADLASQQKSSSDCPIAEPSLVDQASLVETASSADAEVAPAEAAPPSAATVEPAQVPIQPSRERLIHDRQAKLKLWNELKIVSFSRTVTSLYCVALLTLQTHIQLNLIGRFAYLASIEAQTRPQTEYGASEWEGTDEKAGLFGLDHETERLYLTYSWWFLHRGWDRLASRVVQAVERTFSGLPVKAQVTVDELRVLVGSARSAVENELCQDSTKRHNFLDVLFPTDEEQELEALVQSGAVREDEALDTLRANKRLHLLLDETKDIIETADFSSVLQLCLDRVFEVFFDTMAPTFGVHPKSEVITTSGFGADGFTGARIQEIDEEAQKGKSVRLASLFPSVARQGQLAIHGVPNEYIEALADSKELRAFSAVIYSAWPQESTQ